MVSRSVLDIRVDSAKTPQHCGILSWSVNGEETRKSLPFSCDDIENPYGGWAIWTR